MLVDDVAMSRNWSGYEPGTGTECWKQSLDKSCVVVVAVLLSYFTGGRLLVGS